MGIKPTGVFVYLFRGPVERWSSSKRGYIWVNGYSENGPSGGVQYPWLTRAECLAEARRRGGRAVFRNQMRERMQKEQP